MTAATGLPLRIREIGCSAGLNLQWERYRYRLGPHRWSDRDAPVSMNTDWSGEPPQLSIRPRVESRAGCDLDPPRIDFDSDMRRLESFVWADQAERLLHLRAAICVARADPPRIDTVRAGDWLAGEIDPPADGVCTVVYHSAVWTYLPDDEQRHVRGLIGDRGDRATDGCPLAWLRHEDTGEHSAIEIRLTLWPTGEERILGLGDPHGCQIEWHG